MKTHIELLGIRNPIHDESNYLGDIIADNWPVLLCRTRDSDCLERSNWDAALFLLGGEDSDFIKIHRFGSWACGWFEYLCVCSDDAETMEIATGIESALVGYPVLDEELFSQYEQEEANEVWRDCFSVHERVDYIRENKSQFCFNSFSDIIGCVRGDYFTGYASELIA